MEMNACKHGQSDEVRFPANMYLENAATERCTDHSFMIPRTDTYVHRHERLHG